MPRQERKFGYEDVAKKIDSSSLTTETKSIFKIMLELFKSTVNERDAKVAELQAGLDEDKSTKMYLLPLNWTI